MDVSTPRAPGLDSVVCQICGREFRAVSNTHLVRAHGYDPDNPIATYKATFNIERAESPETRRRQVRSLEETWERQGRLWSPERVLKEIARRAGGNEPLNSQAVRGELSQLVLAARKYFGGWDQALLAAGLDAFHIRRRMAWTRSMILERIQDLWKNGKSLSHSARHRKGDGLVQAAQREFGTWGGALRAAGIDPEATRLTRHWTPERILEEIRGMDSIPPPFEVRRTHPGLWDAARRRWRNWDAAVTAAGRTCPPRSTRTTNPHPGAKTVRDLIYLQYARIIGRSAMGPRARETFQNLRDGRLNWTEIARPVDPPEEDPKACAYCGGIEELVREPVVPRCIRIVAACATCPKLQQAGNEVWACTPCSAEKGTSGLYEFFRRRLAGDEKFHEKIPAIAEKKYLRTIHDCHRCAGSLDVGDADGDGKLTVGDVDSVVARYA